MTDRMDALCRWLNNRVRLSELEKELISCSLVDYKGYSLKAKDEVFLSQQMHRVFEVNGPMPNVAMDVKRQVVAEFKNIKWKLGENKTSIVLLKLVTDCLLICKVDKNENYEKILKHLTLIRPPLKTDKINPIRTENELELLLIRYSFQSTEVG